MQENANATGTGPDIHTGIEDAGLPLLYVSLMWINCVITIAGNIITIIAFLSDSFIRLKPANLLILNLALADLKVGLIALPFDNLWWQLGYWSVGESVCKLWLIVDYAASTQSMTAILMITLDRWWMITNVHTYMKHQTRRRVILAILVTWVFWYLHFACLTILWEPISGVRNIDYSEDCDLAADGVLGVTLYEVVGHFVVPMLILCYLNVKIFIVIRKRATKVKQGIGSEVLDDGSTIARPVNNLNLNQQQSSVEMAAVGGHGVTGTNGTDNNGLPNNSSKTIKRSLKKDKKAAVTLTILVGAFTLCWFPYNIVLILESVAHVSENVLIFADYLLWFNSTLNPVLYVFTNSRYRARLAKMFLGKLCK